MSFFGADGLDHQLKQLKSQLASKGLSYQDIHFHLLNFRPADSELTSIRNEQRKKTDELTEFKRARESVQYQVGALVMARSYSEC